MPMPSADFSISEANLRRWKTIKMAALLPLIVSIVLMFFFKGSMLGIVLFFLILIVGVVLPQICENQVRSHLLLKNYIDQLEKRLSPQ
jgi:hypothetical protein